MADKGQPRLVAVNPRGRRVGMQARRPIRPDRAFAAAPELPAQHLRERFRRHAVGIVEAHAVEMIGDGTGIALGAAIDFHGLDWPQKAGFGKRLSGPARPKNRRFQASFLDFWGSQGFNPPVHRKDASFRPAARSWRPEANARQRCAPSGANVFGVTPWRYRPRRMKRPLSTQLGSTRVGDFEFSKSDISDFD